MDDTSFKASYLVNLRWNAFMSNNITLYDHYKAKVISEIVKAKRSVYTKASRQPARDLWSFFRDCNGSNNNATTDILKNFKNVDEAVNSINTKFASFFNPPSISDNTPFFNNSSGACIFNSNNLTDPFDIFMYLNNLSIHKSMGSDDIPNILYRKGSTFLADPICHIVNCSMIDKTFPDVFKIADVSPITKKDKDLRPISLICIPAKITEHFVLRATKSTFIDKVDSSQYAYLPLSSTACALIDFHDTLTELLELPRVISVAALTFDLSKAFDTVDHCTLLHKLRNHGFAPDFIQWSHSYLLNRNQRVRICGVKSPLLSVSSGVPQGSIIGPYFFILYISDLIPALKSTAPFKYADDYTILCPVIENHDFSVINIRTEVDNVKNWCIRNHLKLNTSKCKILQFHKRNCTRKLDLSVFFHDLKYVESFTLLGVDFNHDLSWSLHFDTILSQASKRLYLLRKLNSLISHRDMHTVFNSIIKSSFEYCAPLFCCPSQNICNLITAFYRRCFKIMRCTNCNSFNANIADRFKFLTVNLLMKADTIAQHKLNCKVPPRLHYTNHFLIKKCKTERRKNSFTIQAPLLANRICNHKL